MKKIPYLIFLILCEFVFAQGRISVESKVDRTTILIGDVITYSVVVSHDPDVEIKTPTLAVNLGQFEIRDYKVQEPVQKDGQIIDQTDYMISTFDTGEFEIPEFEIGYTVAGDTTLHNIKAEAVKIVINSLNPEEGGDIRDIKPPLEPTKNYKRFIIIGAFILSILMIAALLFYYFKRRKAGQSLLPSREKPARPAHEVALEALESLIQSDLIQSGQVKTYYIELSEIIRTYVEGRFFVMALEMTTTQLLSNMMQENIEERYIEMMRKFLESCDLVKFAKFLPEEKDHDTITQLAFDFVNQTKLLPIEEENQSDEELMPEKDEHSETPKMVNETIEEEEK